MGEQSDTNREMEAWCIASTEPDTKQASRGSGTGAIGAATGDRRADSASGSCDTQQVSIAQRSNCCLHYVCGVGSVCEKHTVGGIIGEPKTLKQAEAAEPQQAARRC